MVPTDKTRQWAKAEVRDNGGKEKILREWLNTKSNFPESLWSSILGGIQHQTGRSPEQPTLVDPARLVCKSRPGPVMITRLSYNTAQWSSGRYRAMGQDWAQNRMSISRSESSSAGPTARQGRVGLSCRPVLLQHRWGRGPGLDWNGPPGPWLGACWEAQGRLSRASKA